jgi:mycoredoxin
VTYSQRRPGRPAVEVRDAPVEVYGTQWCANTQGVRRFLDREGVPYVYHDMEREVGAAERVMWWTGGDASHPTIQVGGEILVEPSLAELRSALAREGIM